MKYAVLNIADYIIYDQYYTEYQTVFLDAFESWRLILRNIGLFSNVVSGRCFGHNLLPKGVYRSLSCFSCCL